jgi:2-C-methyl-D-erythritol 4-phosphate cytidylyltransferase
MPRFAVILPAAGQSSRFGGVEKKPFVQLAGRAVWLHAAERFAHRIDVCQCVLVVSPDDFATMQSRYARQIEALRITLAPGGRERFESVANGLALLSAEADFVAVHDAARPCVTAALIDVVFARAIETGAALLALPIVDTIKRDNGHRRVVETVARQGLWLAQTPQVFRRDWLVAAYGARDRLGTAITDDAQLVEAVGHAVHLVPGSAVNRKITTQEDLLFAEAVLPTLTDATKAGD